MRYSFYQTHIVIKTDKLNVEKKIFLNPITPADTKSVFMVSCLTEAISHIFTKSYDPSRYLKYIQGCVFPKHDDTQNHN